MSSAAVVGAGAWGTAFSLVLSEAGTDTTLVARDPSVADAVNDTHVNSRYQPGVALPPSLRATTDIAAAVADAELVFVAMPAQELRGHLATWAASLRRDAVVVSLIKGVELGSTKRMSEVICEVADIPAERVGVVSGPNLAREIALRQPSASVVACRDESVAKRLQEASQTQYFRPYTNPDVVGCELGGAVKNVIALAVGMAAGMGFGDNSKASLITRGLAETARLGRVLGADPMTFAGLAGLGDLVATCSSPLSRNRSVGEHLGQGMSLDEALAATIGTAEGVKSCVSVLDLARKYDVEVPITEIVVSVVHDRMKPRDAVGALMTRTAKAERHGG